MRSRGNDPAEILRRDVLAEREEQRRCQQQLDEAVAAELSALHCLDTARSVQCRCRLQIETHAAAISSLQDELADLARPRYPED